MLNHFRLSQPRLINLKIQKKSFSSGTIQPGSKAIKFRNVKQEVFLSAGKNTGVNLDMSLYLLSDYICNYKKSDNYLVIEIC